MDYHFSPTEVNCSEMERERVEAFEMPVKNPNNASNKPLVHIFSSNQEKGQKSEKKNIVMIITSSTAR